MEFVRYKIDRGDCVIANLHAGRSVGRIHLALHVQPRAGGGRSGQLDEGLVADQWLVAPVPGYNGEQAMLDLVPLCALLRRIDVVGASPTRQPRLFNAVWLSGCLAVWLSGCLAVWLSDRIESDLQHLLSKAHSIVQRGFPNQ